MQVAGGRSRSVEDCQDLPRSAKICPALELLGAVSSSAVDQRGIHHEDPWHKHHQTSLIPLLWIILSPFRSWWINGSPLGPWSMGLASCFSCHCRTLRPNAYALRRSQGTQVQRRVVSFGCWPHGEIGKSLQGVFIWDIGRLWPYSLFLRFEVKIIGSQVTMCAWNPTPATRKWCAPFVVACDPIRARSIIFEGSLAEKLRFRASKFHFWRKSRRKASFLSFTASFLKEVSQKSFVFEFHSFIFEGRLAEKLGFSVWKLQFWMKSRRKASF